MANKLDERFPHGLPDGGVGSEYIHDGENRKQEAYLDYLQRLQNHVFSPETGQTFVPDGG